VGDPGNFVKLNHNGNSSSQTGSYQTLYYHMSNTKSLVYVGQQVTKGQVIGYVGDTGNSTGYHLHFEIRYEDLGRSTISSQDRSSFLDNITVNDYMGNGVKMGEFEKLGLKY
jgi:murein DD-endopeptidase MepM/ murein hydrolase activator NlpD